MADVLSCLRSAPPAGPPPGLPPVLTTPLPADRALPPSMPAASAARARKLIEGRDVYQVVRTGTKVDVGSWIARGRVWLMVLQDSLVVVATAPGASRPLAEEVPFSGLDRSQYNHVTGQLATAPAALGATKGLTMSPVEALQVLAQMYQSR